MNIYNDGNDNEIMTSSDIPTVFDDGSDLKFISNKLDEDSKSIVEKIVNEQSLQGVQDLTQLFNVSQAKKQVLRTMTYNQLLDSITDQMQQRLTKRADQFSNKDLLDYAKVVTDGIDKAHKQINNIDTTPMIQINQQNNMVVQSDDDVDRESRERIIAAAKAAMKFLQQQQIEQQVLSNQCAIVDDELEVVECDDDQDMQLSFMDDVDDEKFDMTNLYNNNEQL